MSLCLPAGAGSCHDRRGDSQPYQALKYSSKSHPSSGDHRHEKMRDAADPSPPNKMLRRSDSPENKYSDTTGHSKAKNVHTQRVRERDGGTSYSPQENSHNHSAVHSSNSHSANPSNNPSKTSDASYDSADDWSEHISSSGKKYYYNCRTEVSQWEKPKEWLEREQRQKEASKMAVNSFPKDRDYRREVMQATAASGFASGRNYTPSKSTVLLHPVSRVKMEDKHSSDASSMLPQNILSQTSRHNDRDYRLPRAETHSSSTPVQHPIKPVVHPTATPSTVSSSPFALQSDHQPKKSFDANGASTLSKLPTPTSSIPAQKTERKVFSISSTLNFRKAGKENNSNQSASGDKSVSHSCTTPSTSSASGLNPTSAPPSSASAVPVSPVPQSPIPPLLQDPNLLRQLLPALQATLQLNNSNVDISKINEVLTAAVTQASLQSILHKILTAGPSAFNITSLISQAAQLSTQAQPSNQSPMSLTSDASSPRSYVSPRISTPQTNPVPIKPLINTTSVSQPKVSTPGVKQGPVSQSASQQPVTADKQQGHEPASPRSLQRSSSQRSPSPGPNHTSSSSTSNTTAVPQNSSARPSCSLTPTLAAHFNENLIKHVQGWPADHAEKQGIAKEHPRPSLKEQPRPSHRGKCQSCSRNKDSKQSARCDKCKAFICKASRLREEAHNMGSVHMSEICTELKNLRSLVRVCEIQATLREQRILFLRQQIKELEKLKNQNSFMV
ncbi:WW domain-containing adapter protein with coiled-coil isoform X4 [Ornithorhynchus anatinus]|uniref:WW domain-containing adapter protein with coiled-coil isoform X4 n=1 Tax=Ornithorhynchus anatinus TaxID=9258 RepID=UPI0010A7F44A|nr:WW domain-containing adapter protein with coiled-coil isoform X4 [Ornithorhynchus anatinus]